MAPYTGPSQPDNVEWLLEEVSRLKAELAATQHKLQQLSSAAEAKDAAHQQGFANGSSHASSAAATPCYPPAAAASTHTHPAASAPTSSTDTGGTGAGCSSHSDQTFVCNHGLTKSQVERYSRHLLLPSVGLAAQERLCRGSVLIVGCGGLGSPAALYLAAAGVGRIGLVDHDVVDISNLHRQVIHTQSRVGMHKATSAAMSCTALNSGVKLEQHLGGFTPANAVQIVEQYDVVLDASDNPPTRYLISDACVATGKPLVSAAAVGTDGQLTVYNYGEDAPCYRCLFPESPAPENCSRCADAGVLGPVPGVMGVLQSLEVIKILGGIGDVMARRLLIFDALAGRFSTVKLRGRRPACVACGDSPQITRDNLSSYDYVSFTGQPATDGPPVPLCLIPPEQRVLPEQLKEVISSHAAGTSSSGAAATQAGSGQPATSGATNGHPSTDAQGGSDVSSSAQLQGVTILDVRPVTQFSLFSLPNSVNIPFEQLEARAEEVKALAARAAEASASASGQAGYQATAAAPANSSSSSENGTGIPGKLVLLCRRGNNSQKTALLLKQWGVHNVTDVVGGIEAWAKSLDPSMPVL